MKFLKLLILPILFFACKSERCPSPLCLPPPYILDVNIVFDTSDMSFTTEELSEVIFSTKGIAGNSVLTTDTIRHLNEENNSGHIIQFLLEGGFSQYFHEIEIPALNHFYIIDELDVQLINDDPCNCPRVHLKSFELNDSLVIFESPTLVLKK